MPIDKKANELEVGDKLHFPNSRHAKEITFISKDETHVTVEGGVDTRWVVPLDRDVHVDDE